MPKNQQTKQPGKARRNERESPEGESINEQSRRNAGRPGGSDDEDAEVTEEESRLFEDHGVRDDSPGRKF